MFGILNCYKPAEMTSRDLVNIAQRRVRPAKIGHAGTLDPLATGVLLLPVGPAVRLTPWLQELPKTYEATFRLGCQTPSADLETEPVPLENRPQPSLDELTVATRNLTGNIQQVPPAYSAVHVDGQRAYKLVREGKAVELKPRRVQVTEFEIVRYAYPEVEARIVCGSGTYIRSLGIDLAAHCGTAAVMTSLVRTAIGPFGHEDACPVEQLREGDLRGWLQPPQRGLPNLPQVTLDEAATRRIQQGQIIALPEAPEPGSDATGTETHLAAIDREGRLIALLVARQGGWRARRCFPRSDSDD